MSASKNTSGAADKEIESLRAELRMATERLTRASLAWDNRHRFPHPGGSWIQDVDEAEITAALAPKEDSNP